MTAEEIRKARLAAKAAAMGGSSTASDNSNKTTTATTPAGGTTDAALQNALDASDAQLNFSYDQQAKNLQKYYDTAKQNANNDALSRGMARSSYVSDRLSGLDSDLAEGLSDLDTQKANAIASARSKLTQSYEDKAASALADEKKEYAGNIMAYYSDYQKEINALQGDGDSSNDWKIPYLQAARQQKMLDLGLTEATVNGGTTGTTGTAGGGGTTQSGGGTMSSTEISAIVKQARQNGESASDVQAALQAYVASGRITQAVADSAYKAFYGTAPAAATVGTNLINSILK